MFDPRTRKRERRRRQKITEKEITNTRNWFLITISSMSWTITGFIFFFVDPPLIKDIPIPSTYLPLIGTFSFSLGASLYLLTGRLRSSLLTSLSIGFFLILRANQLGTFLNLVLLIAINLAIQLYLNPPQTKSDKSN